jgi:hypothetical protein
MQAWLAGLSQGQYLLVLGALSLLGSLVGAGLGLLVSSRWVSGRRKR